MSFDVSVEKREFVTLSDDQMAEVARAKLQAMLGGDGIEDHDGGRWVYRWHHRHGSGHNEYLRLASELDEAVVRVLGVL